ncbi:MAG TPA: NrfD/PsrC family molybdoenzyme membrane anchor subunit [Thermomicrobiales bacterium]|jgi:formate-dependent nitrite reductase membrane component NrfD
MTERAPYGRRKRRDEDLSANADSPRDSRPYRNETYYGRPSIKPSHWGWLIAGYYFTGGLGGGAQVIATVVDLASPERDRTIVRAGRYISLAALLASPPLLIADLHTPVRFYNMLRIVRPTSPMSIGSWALSVFGLFAGLTAVAQGVEDLTGSTVARRAARWLSVPAAGMGMVMAGYTGALSAATSVPLWAAIPRALPTLFGLASTASALAAITLAAEARNAPEGTQHRLERLSLIIGVGELALHAIISQIWRARDVAGPIETPKLGALHKYGMVGLGAALPVAIHAAQQLTGRRSRTGTIIAAAATLAGVFIERLVIVFGGNESARSATDYLRFTQPRKPRMGQNRIVSDDGETQSGTTNR